MTGPFSILRLGHGRGAAPRPTPPVPSLESPQIQRSWTSNEHPYGPMGQALEDKREIEVLRAKLVTMQLAFPPDVPINAHDLANAEDQYGDAINGRHR